MGATESVRQWLHYLQHEVLTGLSLALVRALALFSLAMAEARSCQSGRLAGKARSPALPAGTHLVVLADRGLAWPSFNDLCTRHGWSYLLRLQGQTQVRRTDGRVGELRALCPRPGAPAWTAA